MKNHHPHAPHAPQAPRKQHIQEDVLRRDRACPCPIYKKDSHKGCPYEICTSISPAGNSRSVRLSCRTTDFPSPLVGEGKVENPAIGGSEGNSSSVRRSCRTTDFPSPLWGEGRVRGIAVAIEYLYVGSRRAPDLPLRTADCGRFCLCHCFLL